MTKKISTDDILHLADLAKLRLTPSEAAAFAPQLTGILKFVGELQKVKTKKVEETSQVTGLQNVSRRDEIFPFDAEIELLECSPHPTKQKSIRIPRIL